MVTSFSQSAQPTGNGNGTTIDTGVMCEMCLMTGEFVPSELEPIFGPCFRSCMSLFTFSQTWDRLTRI